MQPMRGIASRRSTILVLSGAAASLSHAENGKPHTTIHQEIDFKVAPDRVYEALLGPTRFSTFTGDAAEIQRQPGGSFKLFGGYIEGRNIGTRTESEDCPGVARSLLVSRNLFTHKVRVGCTQFRDSNRIRPTGIAEKDWEHLNEGWPIRYWEPLHKYLRA